MDKSKYRVIFGQRLSDADKEKVQRKVTSAVRMLHQEGFVHGDVRKANVLMSLISDDVKIHLIDLNVLSL
jgi:tRNA A-37 threonylcarbamoyl transferase component Bud32